MQSTSLMPFVTLFFAAIVVWPVHSPAHNQPVHMKISEVAASSSPGLTSFLSEHLDKAHAPFTTVPLLRNDNVSFVPKVNAPVEWIRQGSHHEDDIPRFMHHFYTVTRSAKELTDTKGWQRWGLSTVAGEPFRSIRPAQSFTWVSQRNNGNIYSWQVARDLQYDALTKSSWLDREAKLPSTTGVTSTTGVSQ